MSFAQVSYKAVLAYLTSNSFFIVPFFMFTWSFSSLHVFAECLFLFPLTLCCVRCLANFFHSPLLSAGDFFTFHGHDSTCSGVISDWMSISSENPTVAFMLFKTRSIEAKDAIKWRIDISLLFKMRYSLQILKHHSSSYQAAGCPGRAAPCSCVIWTLSGTKAHGTGDTRYSKIGLQLGRMQTTR